MFNKIKEMVKRYEELECLVSDQTVTSDKGRYALLMKEMGQLTRVVSRYRDLENVRKQKTYAETIINDPQGDAEMKKMAQDEMSQLKSNEEKLIAELEDILLTEDSESQKNAIVEIRPGTGGEEASLFASDLLRMYTKYAEKKGWNVEIMELTHTDLGGIKQAVISIDGTDVFKFLRYESGGHRVQRVPKTEAQGRIHTSACTVAVLPQAEDVEIDIKREDLQIDAFRAGGAGGQHVNKTSSAIRITHLPTGIVVACQSERSQHRNKDLAMRWLMAKLYEHFNNQKKAERDNIRKQQVGTGDRSDKIRTYNFPQNRITDHRIGHSIHNLDVFMDGNIDEMLQKLQEHDKEEKLKGIAKSK